MKKAGIVFGFLVNLALFSEAMSSEQQGSKLKRLRSTRNQTTTHQRTGSDKQHDLNETVRNQWGLDSREWTRYQILMKGIRGSISPATISPLEVLGVHARSDAERNRYAKLWAKAMFEDTDRVLAFQRAYSKAFKQMYGHINMIDPAKAKKEPHQASSITSNDRLLVFLKAAQCTECDNLLNTVLLQTQSLDVQIDIFFVDTQSTNKSDEKKIREWARKHFSKNEMTALQSGKITLNHDQGKLFKLTQNITAPVPVIYKTNQEETIEVVL